MINFLYGTLVGFIIGYPLGLWAIEYTNKYNARKSEAESEAKK